MPTFDRPRLLAFRQVLRDEGERDVGHLTPPDQTAEGIQMFALCSKKESKADTPGKKEMREEITEKRFGAQAKRYLAQLHREHMIEYKQQVSDQK